MILFLSNGKQIRGDVIKSAVLRSDLAPIPLTLEAEVRADADMVRLLAEGQTITAGADKLYIVKSVTGIDRAYQGQRELAATRITALLEPCHRVGFVRTTAIVKEDATLSAIYRAAGATIKAIDADFPVPRFTCLVGGTPTFPIARALQEEGGVVRWKGSRLKYVRLADLFAQKPVIDVPDDAADDVDSGFTERHMVPWFFSLDPRGEMVFGNREKGRSVQFSPFTDPGRLRALTRCLVRRKVSKLSYAPNILAGDLVNFIGGTKLAVITAAHVFESGTDGSGSNQYTRLWLGSLER